MEEISMQGIVRRTGLGLALALCSATPAQETTDRLGPARKPDPDAVEVRFADGSTMKMSLLEKTVVVNTRYGKLTVPTTEIRRIEFGLRIPEATAKQIETAVGELGSADFKRREAAAARLLELRELAVPALRHASRAADAEASRRARETLKAIMDAAPAETRALKPHDTVVTADFPIAGQIETTGLKVRTPYFGDSQLRVEELRTVRWVAGEPENRLVVDAEKYAQQQETWMDTGFDVTWGAKLRLTAAGTVDLWPIAPEVGKYLAGPDGQQGGGGGQLVGGNVVINAGGVAAVPPPAIPAGGVGRAAPQASPGALLGRIGETGKVFVVGQKWEGVAGEEGKLYLRIVASPWNNPSSGAYEVRVVAGER
jgi:hypothetical protein